MYSCSSEFKKVEFNLRHGLRLVRPRLHGEPSGRPVLATQRSELETIQNICAEAGFPEGPWRANHPEEMKMIMVASSSGVPGVVAKRKRLCNETHGQKTCAAVAPKS